MGFLRPRFVNNNAHRGNINRVYLYKDDKGRRGLARVTVKTVNGGMVFVSECLSGPDLMVDGIISEHG